MRVAAFSTKKYERALLNAAKLAYGHDLVYFDSLLELETASLAAGFAAVCVFVNDRADAQTIDVLARRGTGLIATRSTGFNHVNLKAAAEHGIAVVRVVDYSLIRWPNSRSGCCWHSIARFTARTTARATATSSSTRPWASISTAAAWA